ncbi:MAG: DUF3667 domain-containing protein [Flavobacterium sp.]|uniref:DUF3667 domain-containing protein n=1 Tax=Flavobacterium sp. TaxID=239 RepID=UPI0011F46A7B|nr:DUF3667 domain-containing protein [Flavobacterium sp.]RZJ65957.1 MAG: DUF3667 domain-containing protein [Flavobacterium sp.]
MSGHNPLRQDKTCLNCRHVVEKRYCPNCGQENTDSRKTFHHLFIHFFEDLTHYENAFWKTIRHLLFKPGRLTKEYLSGKRLSYLAPVRLYIFISFVTFFLLGVLPSKDEDNTTSKIKKEIAANPATADTLVSLKPGGIGDFSISRPPEEKEDDKSKNRDIDDFGDFDNVREFDSIQNSLPESKKLHGFRYMLEHKLAEIQEKTDDKDFADKLTDGFVHNVPKALFLYMPLFAFWLWVFHGKKRWYYFDHGIFTLHYFSFLLLTMMVMNCLATAAEFFEFMPFSVLVGLMWFCLCGWWFFYFFRSHSNFYGERKAISRLKSLALYIINMVLISIFAVGLLTYTILYMH